MGFGKYCIWRDPMKSLSHWPNSYLWLPEGSCRYYWILNELPNLECLIGTTSTIYTPVILCPVLALVLLSTTVNACGFTLSQSCHLGGYWISYVLLLIALGHFWAASIEHFSSLCACARTNLPYQFAPFGQIWAESGSCTLEFIPQLSRMITPSINTSDLLPLAVVCVKAMDTAFKRQCAILFVVVHSSALAQINLGGEPTWLH